MNSATPDGGLPSPGGSRGSVRCHATDPAGIRPFRLKPQTPARR